MKRKIFISIFALTLILSLTGCGENNSSSNNNMNGNNSDNMISDIQSGMQSTQNGTDNASLTANPAISREQAKEIALNRAKLKDSDINNYRIELDRDDGVLVYEVDFNSGNTEYSYEIDANTGTIRERDRDIMD